MGGHVTARSIEQHPEFYDGALPLCGVVGDVELFDFFLDFTFVGQALAGVEAYPIPADYQTRVVPRIQAALGTVGIGLGPPTNPRGLQFRAIVVEQSGGPRPGAEVAFSFWKRGPSCTANTFSAPPRNCTDSTIPPASRAGCSATSTRSRCTATAVGSFFRRAAPF